MEHHRLNVRRKGAFLSSKSFHETLHCLETTMTINLSVPVTHDLKPRLTVMGVGGAGCNAVNNMITGHLEGGDFVVANTDAQALTNSLT